MLHNAYKGDVGKGRSEIINHTGRVHTWGGGGERGHNEPP